MRALFLLTLCAACSSPKSTTKTPEKVEVSGFVLVPSAAAVRTAPALDAPFGTASGPSGIGDVWAMPVVADLGDFVHVATGHEGACYPLPYQLGGYELDLFVAKQDLRRVVTTPVRVTYPDGTWVELEPGLALGPDEGIDAEGRVIVAAMGDGATYGVALPADAIGLSYAVAPSYQDLGTDIVTLSGDLPKLGGDARLGVRGWPESGILAAIASDAPGFSTIRASCLRMHVQGEDLVGGSGTGDYGGFGYGGPVTKVRPGAPLTWPDGSPAGTSVTEHVVWEGTDAPDGRTCWPIELTGWWHEGEEPRGTPLTVCAAPEDLTGGGQGIPGPCG